MPEVTFRIRWPDGAEASCYSPSRVVAEYLRPATSYPLGDFLARSRAALGAASERVRERFGVPCSRAMAQLAAIERTAHGFADLADASVTVLALHPGPQQEAMP